MQKNNSLLRLVQEALAKDAMLRTSIDNIYILVNDCAVIMAGSVTQESLKTRAKKILSSVPGINLIIDDLRVEPHPHRVGVQIDWAKGSMALE